MMAAMTRTMIAMTIGTMTLAGRPDDSCGAGRLVAEGMVVADSDKENVVVVVVGAKVVVVVVVVVFVLVVVRLVVGRIEGDGRGLG
jgi:hypothetical protein